jgi:hypothetical protein
LKGFSYLNNIREPNRILFAPSPAKFKDYSIDVPKHATVMEKYMAGPGRKPNTIAEDWQHLANSLLLR